MDTEDCLTPRRKVWRDHTQSGWRIEELFIRYLRNLHRCFSDQPSIWLVLSLAAGHRTLHMRNLARPMNIDLRLMAMRLTDEHQPLDREVFSPMNAWCWPSFTGSFEMTRRWHSLVVGESDSESEPGNSSTLWPLPRHRSIILNETMKALHWRPIVAMHKSAQWLEWKEGSDWTWMIRLPPNTLNHSFCLIDCTELRE
jgi:hypothetical protein